MNNLRNNSKFWTEMPRQRPFCTKVFPFRKKKRVFFLGNKEEKKSLTALHVIINLAATGIPSLGNEKERCFTFWFFLNSHPPPFPQKKRLALPVQSNVMHACKRHRRKKLQDSANYLHVSTLIKSDFPLNSSREVFSNFAGVCQRRFYTWESVGLKTT